MSGIYWLASYPKSGNTWTRSFLANLVHGEESPIDINELFTGAIASSREWVAAALGIEIDELSHDEVDALRPLAYRWIATNDSGDYHKIHDAYTLLNSGQPLVPPDATAGAVCLIRNPLDVAISYANHSSITIDKAIEALCKPDHAFCKTKRGQRNQLRQQLFTWSDHVQSWLDAPIPKCVMRYEDMRADPQGSFSRIAAFLGIEASAEDVARALEQCRFDRLQAQENESGFKEKAPKVKNFFRKGVAGDWQGTLSDKQIQKIIEANRPAMQRMGYLDAKGKPVIALPEFAA